MSNIHTMVKTDFRRMLHQPLLPIMIMISFAIPVLVLTMTTGFADSEAAGMAFSNTWQMIGSLPSGVASGAMNMDMSAMMNINLLYFMIAVLVCIFVADDFRSGYVKNLFTVRAKKGSYVVSKIIVCSIASVALFAAFLIGSLLGGSLAGLSFAMDGFHAFNIILAMAAKIFIIPMFVALYLITGVIAKRRLWLSICLSLSIGMLFFMIVPLMTGLSASVMSVLMCLAGGLIFGAGFGGTGKMLLERADLV